MKILERRKRSINVVVKAKMRKRWQMLEMKMMIAIKKPVLEFEYLDAQSLRGLNWFDSFILLLLPCVFSSQTLNFGH